MGNNGHDNENLPAIDGEKPSANLNVDSLEGLFSSPQGHNDTRLLFEASESLPELLMRANLPDNAVALCAALSMQRCKENGYQAGIDFWKAFISGMAAKHGARAQLFSDTVIGEKHSGARQGRWDKFKQFMGGGED